MGTSSQLFFAFPCRQSKNKEFFVLKDLNLISCSVNELFAGIMPENINYALLLSVTILLG